jgi:hypothetical protein
MQIESGWRSVFSCHGQAKPIHPFRSKFIRRFIGKLFHPVDVEAGDLLRFFFSLEWKGG